MALRALIAWLAFAAGGYSQASGSACADLRDAQAERIAAEQRVARLESQAGGSKQRLDPSTTSAGSQPEGSGRLSALDIEVREARRAVLEARRFEQDAETLFEDAAAPIRQAVSRARRQARTAAALDRSTGAERCGQIASNSLRDLLAAMKRYDDNEPCLVESGREGMRFEIREEAAALLELECLPESFDPTPFEELTSDIPFAEEVKGPKAVVPSVRGLYLVDAETILAEAGFETNSFEVRGAPSKRHEGLVAWQSPPSGERVPKGARIDVAYYGAFEEKRNEP